MSLPRALTWAHLFPAELHLAFQGVPPGFRQLAETIAQKHGLPALLAWRCAASSLRSLDDFAGLIAINCPDLSDAWMRELGFEYARHFAVLPSLEQAMWFVPLETAALARGALCLHTPLRWSARLKHLGINLLARTHLPLWYRDSIWIAQRKAPPIEQLLQNLYPGQGVRLALSSGPRGPDLNRKTSAAILDPHGLPQGFVKFSGTDISRQQMKHEAAVLRALAGMPGPNRLAPRLLHAGELDQTYVTIQTPVLGQRVGTELTEAHRRSLELLRRGERKPAAATEMIRSLRKRLAESEQHELLAILEQSLPVLESTLVPSTIVHTDFAPWNLRQRNGMVVAFDWDSAELDGLPLFDQQHHELIVGYLLKHWGVEKALEYLRETDSPAELGLSRPQVRAIQAAHVVHFLLRLLDLGHSRKDPMVAWYWQVLEGLRMPRHEAVAA